MDTTKSMLSSILQIPGIENGVTVNEVIKATRLSRATAQRRLAEFVFDGKLERSGKGRATLYKRKIK